LLFERLGERLSDEEVNQLIAGQGDPNGQINISDFVHYILQA
jgi:Ca2+-binding EF-hand superfamily protein